uniref:Uncharacterized protein n=1 Tax=Lygus hesperus TaxID=30085 RepID=A0A146LPA3_LYGHE
MRNLYLGHFKGSCQLPQRWHTSLVHAKPLPWPFQGQLSTTSTPHVDEQPIPVLDAESCNIRFLCFLFFVFTVLVLVIDQALFEVLARHADDHSLPTHVLLVVPPTHDDELLLGPQSGHVKRLTR